LSDFPVGMAITAPSYALTLDKKALRRVMASAGNEVAAVARALVRRSAGGGRTYRGSGGSSAYRGYKPGHYTASSPTQAPVSVTGTLARSIKAYPFKSGEGVAVRDSVFYALFLEVGAQGGVGSGRKGVKGRRNKRGGNVGSRVLTPRPFLSEALDQRQASLGARVQEAMLEGIAFRRLKA